MNENFSTPSQAISQESSAANSPKPLRLKFPIGVVLIFWALHFVIGNLEKPYFYGFLFQMASAGLFILLFLSWWWFNRGLRLLEKFFGFVLIVAGGVIIGMLSHLRTTAGDHVCCGVDVSREKETPLAESPWLRRGRRVGVELVSCHSNGRPPIHTQAAKPLALDAER
jgi:hypothetical protein